MSQSEQPLENRVIILNGFTDPEIIAVMNVVKSIYADTDMDEFVRFVEAAAEQPQATEFSKKVLRVIAAAKQLPVTREVAPGDLIFARTTENSLQMKLADLIVDMSEDHEYLKNNPPQRAPDPPKTDRQDTDGS